MSTCGICLATFEVGLQRQSLGHQSCVDTEETLLSQRKVNELEHELGDAISHALELEGNLDGVLIELHALENVEEGGRGTVIEPPY